MADSEYADDETEYEGPSSQAIIWVCFLHVSYLPMWLTEDRTRSGHRYACYSPRPLSAYT